jgi:hypothetical protein
MILCFGASLQEHKKVNIWQAHITQLSFILIKYMVVTPCPVFLDISWLSLDSICSEKALCRLYRDLLHLQLNRLFGRSRVYGYFDDHTLLRQ